MPLTPPPIPPLIRSPKDAPNIVVAVDSFKGSIDAAAACAAIADGIRRALPTAHIHEVPMADGGEGTLDALVSQGARRVSAVLRDAASVARANHQALAQLDGHTWVIESAAIVGLGDAGAAQRDVEQRSTEGLGDALRATLERGARRIYLALGGSSTNDGGAGMLAALGARLLDAEGIEIEPTPAGLARLDHIDLRRLDARLRTSELIALSDVDNPLTGVRGASAVFGPQKGLHADRIVAVDQALARFATLAESAFARAARDLPGSGAAGGLGFALALLGARFQAGAEFMMARARLPQALAHANWLITGEGRSDGQTLGGKVPYVVARAARAAGVPASLLSGAIDLQALPELAPHFAGCFSLVPGPMSLEQAIARAPELLSHAAEQLARLRFDDACGAPTGTSGTSSSR